MDDSSSSSLSSLDEEFDDEDTSLLLGFTPVHEHSVIKHSAVIPKELDIFYNDISTFLPKNKNFSDLTRNEEIEIMNRYRFDPLYPGLYQCISGFESVFGRVFNKAKINVKNPEFLTLILESNEIESSSSSSSSSSSE